MPTLRYIKGFGDLIMLISVPFGLGLMLICPARMKSQRVLYLAVPQLIYDDFFTVQEFAQLVVQTNQIKIIVYNPVLETIVQWIN